MSTWIKRITKTLVCGSVLLSCVAHANEPLDGVEPPEVLSSEGEVRTFGIGESDQPIAMFIGERVLRSGDQCWREVSSIESYQTHQLSNGQSIQLPEVIQETDYVDCASALGEAKGEEPDQESADESAMVESDFQAEGTDSAQEPTAAPTAEGVSSAADNVSITRL